MSALMPVERDTMFLRACVLEGAAARAAWQEWLQTSAPTGNDAEILRALAERRMFAPLLHWNLARNRIENSDRVRTYLRSAGVTEELRSQKYAEICGAMLRTLADAHIPCIVLEGAAFSERYYETPFLRHSGDVDLLLRKADLPRAAARLRENGWRIERESSLIERYHRHVPPLVHSSGLPLDLHHRVAATFYSVPYDDLWTRSHETQVAGAPARVLSDADNLLHLCLHATVGRRGLQWVPDAALLIDRAKNLDWTVFVTTTRTARAAIPVHTVLRYLADRISVHVPGSVLRETAALAAAAGYLERRAARPIPVGSPGEIWTSAESPWHGVRRLYERALPSPVSLAVQFDIPMWQIPFAYVQRTVRIVRYLVRLARKTTCSVAAQ